MTRAEFQRESDDERLTTSGDVEMRAAHATQDTIWEAIRRQSVTRSAAWFVIIDAAQDPSLLERAAAAGLQTQSLYAGELGARLDHVAPHLVALDLESEFAADLVEQWDTHHAILLQATAPFDELRKHFRRFLLVKDEAGTQYRLRFYDARVLRAFLPACTSAEAREFFGPVERFYCPDRDTTAVLALAVHERGVRVARLSSDPDET